MEVSKRGLRFPFKVNLLFVKILCYFLSLLIPTLIISIVYYINVVNDNRNELTERLGLHLQTAAGEMDTNLRTIQAANQSFLQNKTVRSLLKPANDLTLEERAQLTDLISELQNINGIMHNLIDSVFTYVDDQKVYSPSGIQDFDNFFARGYHYDQYTAQDWRAKLNNINGFIEILQRTNVDIFEVKNVPVIPFISYDTINGNHVVVVANLSIATVRQTLQGNQLFPDTHFLVTDASGKMLYGSSDLALDQANRIVQQGGQEIANSKITIDGETYLVSYEQSDEYGWQLYGITPTAEFKLQAAGLRNFIVILCAVLLIAGIVFAFIFAFRIYSPIKKIHDILIADNTDEYRVFANQENNELSTIGVRVNQLQKVNEWYRSTLTKNAYERIEHAILLLLQGSYIPHEDKIEQLLSIHYGFRSSDYLCCTIFFEFKDKFFKDFQDIDRINILSKMTKVISGLMKEYVPAFAIEYSPHMYVCILNTNENPGSQIREALNAMMRTFEYDSTFSIIHVGVGQSYSELSSIQKSYNEAMTALQNRDVQLDFEIIYAQSLEIEHRYNYSFADENKILNHLRKGELASAQEAIVEVVRNNEARHVSHPHIHLLLTALYNTVLRFGTERVRGNIELVTEEDHLVLSGITQPPVDTETKLVMINQLCQQLLVREIEPDNKTGNMIEAIIAYVDNHYQEDIYLDTIAQEIGISPKYVSRLFKEKTGMNLTDYISVLRIEKAKELLIQTKDNVNDIALRVGIYSRATFQRLFKKYEGISPNEYRKSQRQE